MPILYCLAGSFHKENFTNFAICSYSYTLIARLEEIFVQWNFDVLILLLHATGLNTEVNVEKSRVIVSSRLEILHTLIYCYCDFACIRGGGRKFCSRGQILTVAREARAKFLGTRPFNWSSRSLVAIGGAATVRNQEMVENVHCDRFLKLL